MKPPQRVPAVLSVLVPSLGLAQTAPVPQPWLDATLALAERGEWAALKLQARRQPDPMARLYAAYLLYRQAPQEHRTGFLEALPEDEAGRRAYAGLAALLETDSASGRRPRPPPDLWALQDSLLVLAKGGEEKAIRWLLAIPRCS